MHPSQIQPARFSSSLVHAGLSHDRVTGSMPQVEWGSYDLNTENFTTDFLPSVLTELSDIEQLMQMRSTQHLSSTQVGRREKVLNLFSLFLQTEALATTSLHSQSDCDVSKKLFQFLMEWTIPGFTHLWGSDFDPVTNPEVLSQWAYEHGISQHEIQMLLTPMAGTENGLPSPSATDGNFIRFKADSPRKDFLEDSSTNWGLDEGFGDSEMNWTAALSLLDEAGFSGYAVASRPELTQGHNPRDTRPTAPVGTSSGSPQLVAFMMPNEQGEPIIALTFSRSF